MRVTVVCGALASNGIARPWILAQLLSRHHDVEAIGALRRGEEIWPGLADYPWQAVPVDGTPSDVRRLEAAITGEVVVAYGIRLLSFGAALLSRWHRGVGVILDLPEWQVFEHYTRRTRAARALMVARHLAGPGWSDASSFKYRYVLDHLTWLADARTVACDFLKRRYRGVLLPQGPDTVRFDPARFDKRALRRKWSIPETAAVLLFGGNPQPGKGLRAIVDALNHLDGRIDARLVMVGRAETHPYTRELITRGRGKVIAIGTQPFHRMPELLAAADLVALPINRSPKTLGYVPCKLYEAMAMELPVVVSDVSDMPAIVDGCGYVVPADDADGLRTTIEYVLRHPEEAREMGRRARQRVLERYSWDVMDRILQDVVASVTTRAKARRSVATEH